MPQYDPGALILFCLMARKRTDLNTWGIIAKSQKRDQCSLFLIMLLFYKLGFKVRERYEGPPPQKKMNLFPLIINISMLVSNTQGHTSQVPWCMSKIGGYHSWHLSCSLFSTYFWPRFVSVRGQIYLPNASCPISEYMTSQCNIRKWENFQINSLYVVIPLVRLFMFLENKQLSFNKIIVIQLFLLRVLG